MSNVGQPVAPYRVPCWLANWPTVPALTLCTQHKVDSERNIAEKCNAHRSETAPAWVDDGGCGETEEWKAGNCYGTCPKGDAHGLTTDGASYPAGTTTVSLGSGVGIIYVGDRIKFAGDETLYTVSSTAGLPFPLESDTDLTGFNFTISEPGLVLAITTSVAITIQDRGYKDFSVCNKTGWKAVRSMKMWHGRRGWQSGCDECDTSTVRYRTIHRDATYTQVSYGIDQDDYDAAMATYTACMGSAADPEDAKTCMDDFLAAVEAAKTSGPTTIYSYSWERQYSVSTNGEVTQDACSNTDGSEGWMESGSATYNSAPARLLLYGDWKCGPNFDITHDYGADFNDWFGGGVPDLEWSVEIIQDTDTVTEIRVVGASFSAGQVFVNTWYGKWTLSEPYTLEDCVTEAYGMSDEWDLSNDVQYPWRPAGSWLVDIGGGVTQAAKIPLVRLREVGPNSPDVIGAVCGADLSCSLSLLTPDCPYDGAMIGAPLPNGYGPHYAYWDGSETSGSPTITPLGWNPGLGLPETATWWTSSLEELDETVFPSGGWVKVLGGIVYVQKWAETKDTYDAEGTYIGSVNFFRPCGDDDRVTWGTDYKAICGRLGIAEMALDAGTLTVTLSSAADYLQTGDLVDFVKYGAAPAYTETVDNGGSKSVPDTAGYSVTVTDSTHFTITGLAGTPDATHIKSHDAPHYKWHDNLRKGDFTFCVEETSCGTPTNSCEAGCLPLSSCSPAVAAVLPPNSPETFEDADTFELFAAADVENSYTYRVKPRIYEDDPFYTGTPPAPQVEPRCDLPTGAPSFPAGVAYAGCGTLPAFRPALARQALTADPVREAICQDCEWNVNWRCEHVGCKVCPGRATALGPEPLKRLLASRNFRCPLRKFS